MRTLIKTLLRGLLIPCFRVLAPAFENVRRIYGYLLLSSRVSHPVPASVVVLGAPEVRGNGDVHLGEHLLFYPDIYLETHPGAALHIGDHVVMSRGVHLVAYAGIRIGAGTMIGEYTSIRDANHVRDTDGSMRDGAHFSSPISIGSKVWIGRGVTILPGVTVGNNATVGANAVVTRDVPAGVTVVGIPAHPIRPASHRDELEKTSFSVS